MQTPEQAADGPTELMFVHGGHGGAVNDLSWNPMEPWVLASVGSATDDLDNTVHVWQMVSNALMARSHFQAETIYTECEAD